MYNLYTHQKKIKVNANELKRLQSNEKLSLERKIKTKELAEKHESRIKKFIYDVSFIK